MAGSSVEGGIGQDIGLPYRRRSSADSVGKSGGIVFVRTGTNAALLNDSASRLEKHPASIQT